MSKTAPSAPSAPLEPPPTQVDIDALFARLRAKNPVTILPGDTKQSVK